MESDLKQLVKSLNARLTNLEDGFTSTHEQEGLWERLRATEKFQKRTKWAITIVGGAVLSLIVKSLWALLL